MAFEQYTTYTTSAMAQTILPAIAAYFTEKYKVLCTVDELIAALRVPTSVQAQVASVAATASKPKAAKAANGKGGGCQYRLTRGERKDQTCDANVKPGETYCTTCKKKKSVGGAGAKAASKSVGNVPGTPNFGTPQAPPANDKVNAEQWKGEDAEFKDLLFIPLYQILVRQEPAITCYGRVVNNKRVPLDEATTKTVMSLGIPIAECAKYQPQAMVNQTILTQAAQTAPVIPVVIAGITANVGSVATPAGGAATSANLFSMPGMSPIMAAPTAILAQANGGAATAPAVTGH